MNSIHISHNPFTVQTDFLINGIQPAEGCKLVSYRESRLQQWIEKLFGELRVLFNGEQQYDITFRGVESDFLDLQEAALKAQAAGAEVRLHWEEVLPAEQRLAQIRALWKEVTEHPQISAHVQGNREAREEVAAAFSKDFDVYVVATMSSGKSTLINAMLGTSLLPAANEATTAKIARITDNDTMADGFRARRLNRENEVLDEADQVTAATLVDWNRAEDTFSIELEGNIKAVREREDVRLVLSDTPGPNNSQDADHARITMRHILDTKRNPLILYILNATQLGIDDDRNLLNMIAESMSKGGKQSKDRFVFVVNKMDQFDPEKEHIPSALDNVRSYLQKNGIAEPVIYPVSAEFTRLLRLPYESLSRAERSRLNGFSDVFEEVESMDLNQYMPVTEKVKRHLSAKSLAAKEVRSGLPAVESMIEEYIDKYNLPHRIKRVHDALQSVIGSAINAAELIESMDRNESELKQIRAELAQLEAKKSKGFDALAFKERLKNERTNLPSEAMEMLAELKLFMGRQLRENGLKFQKKKELSIAKKIVEATSRDLSSLQESCVAKFDVINELSQDSAKMHLENAYDIFVKDVFHDVNEIEFPTLEKMRKSMNGFARGIDFSIADEDIETRKVVIGERKVSTSTWYKPWSWGDVKVVKDTRNEDCVDLGDFWKKNAPKVEKQFRDFENQAMRELEKNHGQLVDRMLEFMNHEFDERFNALLESVKQRSAAGDEKEAEIQSAKQLLADASSMFKRLNAIISMEFQHG